MAPRRWSLFCTLSLATCPLAGCARGDAASHAENDEGLGFIAPSPSTPRESPTSTLSPPSSTPASSSSNEPPSLHVPLRVPSPVSNAPLAWLVGTTSDGVLCAMDAHSGETVSILTGDYNDVVASCTYPSQFASAEQPLEQPTSIGQLGIDDESLTYSSHLVGQGDSLRLISDGDLVVGVGTEVGSTLFAIDANGSVGAVWPSIDDATVVSSSDLEKGAVLVRTLSAATPTWIIRHALLTSTSLAMLNEISMTPRGDPACAPRLVRGALDVEVATIVEGHVSVSSSHGAAQIDSATSIPDGSCVEDIVWLNDQTGYVVATSPAHSIVPTDRGHLVRFGGKLTEARLTLTSPTEHEASMPHHLVVDPSGERAWVTTADRPVGVMLDSQGISLDTTFHALCLARSLAGITAAPATSIPAYGSDP